MKKIICFLIFLTSNSCKEDIVNVDNKIDLTHLKIPSFEKSTIQSDEFFTLITTLDNIEKDNSGSFKQGITFKYRPNELSAWRTVSIKDTTGKSVNQLITNWNSIEGKKNFTIKRKFGFVENGQYQGSSSADIENTIIETKEDNNTADSEKGIRKLRLNNELKYLNIIVINGLPSSTDNEIYVKYFGSINYR